MISELRRATARANGARSRGPKTAEGKRKSSRNSLKHGLYATIPVMLEESLELLAQHLDAFVDQYQPRTPHALALVQPLGAADWLIARTRQTEADLLNAACAELEAADPAADPRTLACRAYRHLSTSPRLSLLGNCQSRYNRLFDQAYDLLSQQQIRQRTKLSTPPQPAAQSGTAHIYQQLTPLFATPNSTRPRTFNAGLKPIGKPITPPIAVDSIPERCDSIRQSCQPL